jgi:hypothetical protein
MFIYNNDPMIHWLYHLLALSAAKLFMPVLLIYLLWFNNVRSKEFFKQYFGLFLFMILCYLYFPTYLGDLKFIDKYDWFTVATKLFIWILSAGLTLTSLINYKE